MPKKKLKEYTVIMYNFENAIMIEHMTADDIRKKLSKTSPYDYAIIEGKLLKALDNKHFNLDTLK